MPMYGPAPGSDRDDRKPTYGEKTPPRAGQPVPGKSGDPAPPQKPPSVGHYADATVGGDQDPNHSWARLPGPPLPLLQPPESADVGHPSIADLNDQSQAGLPTQRDREWIVDSNVNNGLPAGGTSTPVSVGQSAKDAGAQSPDDMGSGGAQRASYSASASGPSGTERAISGDYAEQLQAMEDERNARTAENETNAAELGKQGDFRRQQAAEGQASADARNREARRHLDEISVLAKDYADDKIDPHKWWGDKNVPQKIATVLGAMALGFNSGFNHHDRNAGVDMINDQINRSVSLQMEEHKNKGRALYEADNLYNSFLKTSADEQEAETKTRAALWDAAISDSGKAALAAKDPVQRAQTAQFIAGLKLQRDMLLGKLSSARVSASAAMSAGGGQPNFIPLENGASTATLNDGTTLYVGHGGDDVAKAIEFSDRTAEAATGLADYIKRRPSPSQITAYQEWFGGLRERLKEVSVLGSQHMGAGSRGNVATMKAYSVGIAGPENDPTTWAGPIDAAKMESYQANAMIKNAHDLARNSILDRDSIIHAHGAIPGRMAAAQVRGTGEYKGMTVQKPVFIPGGHMPAKQPEKPSTTSSFKPNP